MRMIVSERLEDLLPEEIHQGSRGGYFCSWCKREVSLTADSQRQADGAKIYCVPCYKRVVIKGGLGYVSRLRKLAG